MALEETLGFDISGYLWVIIVGTFVLVGLRIWTRFRVNRFNAVVKEQRRKDREMPDDELEAYINNPEETIKILMAKRDLNKGDAGANATIDQQIKMLEMVAKIPQPMRPTVVKLGKRLMSSIEGVM